MREMYLAMDLETVAFATADRGGAPFADPVQCDDGRAFEGGWEEGARGVGLMMFGEQ